MQFNDILNRALTIRSLYAELEEKRFGRKWTKEEVALGFVGDVGDLAKLVIAAEGIREIPDAEAKLAHELADCLWSVLVLSHQYNINLEKVFLETMDKLEAHLKSLG